MKTESRPEGPPDAVSQKERPFKMKAEPPNIRVRFPATDQQPILDAEGLNKAYQKETLTGTTILDT